MRLLSHLHSRARSLHRGTIIRVVALVAVLGGSFAAIAQACFFVPAFATISGQVHDQSGNPVPGATVTLLSGEAPLFSPDRLVSPLTTEGDGAFGFLVPLGSYEVQIQKDGCVAYTSSPLSAVPAPQPLPAGVSFTTVLPTKSISGVDVPVLTWGSPATVAAQQPPNCWTFMIGPTVTLAGQTTGGVPHSQSLVTTYDFAHGVYDAVIPDLTTSGVVGQATLTLSWYCMTLINIGGFPFGGFIIGNSVTTQSFTVFVQQSAAPLVVTPLVNVTGGSFQHGQGGTFTATVSQTVPAALGAMQFKVDGVNLGAPVALDSNGSATSPDLSTASGFPFAAGSHGVEADYIPADVTKWGAALGTAGFTVNKAASSTSLALQGSSAVATVSALAPGSGTPTGVVSFTRDGADIGTAQLTNGVATLTGLTDGAANVAATYAGDTNFTGSSASTARQMPTIVATVTSRIAKTSYGWYRSPVTVSFACTTNGSPLTAPCPSPVTLASSGAAQSVTETILAQDGGAATAVVNGINIDRGRPRLWVEGVTNGHRYASAPTVSCVGEDALSGIASCTVAVDRARHGVVRYTATATDKAGNIKTVRGAYLLG